jgi:hypothetical protein
MKKLLAVALPAGIVLLVAVTGLGRYRALEQTAQASAERARLKRDFAERAALGRTIPVDRAPEWRDEVQALSRWYFEELAAVRNRHPGEPPRPTGLEAAKTAKGNPSDQERSTMEEFQKYADARYAMLRDAGYAPVASAIDQGLRLDLLAVEPGPSPEGGGPGLRIEFALWGAPRYLERERDREKTTTRSIVPVVFRRIAFSFLDAKGKPYGEMSGGGEPYLKLADPERWVEDFPPGVLFGTWWVELLPREAVTVEVQLETAARGATGSERPVLFKLAMPVPDTWKIPAGATYQAEVREAAPAP